MDSQDDKVATILLTEVYNDYKRDKRNQRLYKWFYILIIVSIIYMSFKSFSQMSFLDELSDARRPLQTENFVPVIEIKGPIGLEDLRYETINHLLEEAFEIEKAPGVILHIESPGGYPYDCYEVTRKIRSLKEKYPNKKVIAQVGSLSASGGYYIASAADKIYASEASLIGSIGVIMQYIQYNKFLEDYNLLPHVFQAGKDKVAIHPLKDLTEEAVLDLQNDLDEHHKIFIDTVRFGRGEKLNEELEPLFTGKVWFGTKAKTLGLIDELGLFDDMLLEEFGDDIEAHVIEEDFGLDLKRLLNQKPRIKIEGPDLNAKTLLHWNGS